MCCQCVRTHRVGGLVEMAARQHGGQGERLRGWWPRGAVHRPLQVHEALHVREQPVAARLPATRGVKRCGSTTLHIGRATSVAASESQ